MAYSLGSSSTYGPCPDCGHAPSALLVKNGTMIVVGCQNKECSLYNRAFSPEKWAEAIQAKKVPANGPQGPQNAS